MIYFNPLFSPSNHKYDIRYDYIDPHIGKIVSDEGMCLPNGQREEELVFLWYMDHLSFGGGLKANQRGVPSGGGRGTPAEVVGVILDGVFNRCRCYKWMDGAHIMRMRKDMTRVLMSVLTAPYGNYFDFHNQAAWACKQLSYDDRYGDMTHLPKLNYEKMPELMDYVLHVAKNGYLRPTTTCGMMETGCGS